MNDDNSTDFGHAERTPSQLRKGWLGNLDYLHQERIARELREAEAAKPDMPGSILVLPLRH